MIDPLLGTLKGTVFEGLGTEYGPILLNFVKVVGLLVACVIVNWITRNIILRVVRTIIKRTQNKRDDVFLESGALTRLSHILPALVIHFSAPLLFSEESGFLPVLQTAVSVYLILITLFVFDGVLNAIHKMLATHVRAGNLPLKGFIQAIKLIAIIVGLILIISVLVKKPPFLILSGLGALTAVFMLVFRDAILGFVAGIQISVNNMVRPGDWIEMQSNSANGDVIDVSLTTVKVRNFDKTITSIPSYDLISKSFINWRGMSDSGGRRIKRSLRINLRTIRFVDEDLLKELRRIQLLRPYLEKREKEVREWNRERKVDEEMLVNGRRLTNLGCFRAYCEAYLREDDRIRKDMTFLFRQLEADGQGLPFEIYVFTATTNWVRYESIQSDIFDHLFAVLPAFGLSAYQEPSGEDWERGLAQLVEDRGFGKAKEEDAGS